jgi:3-methyl-2-oxobutanoate hydroxymethyltransferase
LFQGVKSLGPGVAKTALKASRKRLCAYLCLLSLAASAARFFVGLAIQKNQQSSPPFFGYGGNVTKKVSILELQKKKRKGNPITMLTAYDFPGARLVDEAGVDIVLVGDSLAMTVLGHPNTIAVTMDEMLHHCKAVARGARRAFLVGDMPFMSYQVDRAEAIRNAGRFLKEGGMDAIKLEGGHEVLNTVKAIVQAGIPVMGHLGLTPQTITKLGGFKVQATTAEDATRLHEDALALQEAGCFSIVIEAVPAAVAEAVSQQLTIPTIGIGAGPGCDGQVLVFHDVLGLFDEFVPKFVKQYANLRQPSLDAFEAFVAEVETRTFPTPSHSFKINEEQLQIFLYGSGN